MLQPGNTICLYHQLSELTSEHPGHRLNPDHSLNIIWIIFNIENIYFEVNFLDSSLIKNPSNYTRLSQVDVF